jgi:hypothetical protein
VRRASTFSTVRDGWFDHQSREFRSSCLAAIIEVCLGTCTKFKFGSSTKFCTLSSSYLFFHAQALAQSVHACVVVVFALYRTRAATFRFSGFYDHLKILHNCSTLSAQPCFRFPKSFSLILWSSQAPSKTSLPHSRHVFQ